MATIPVVYPKELPAPRLGTLTPTERRHSSSVHGTFETAPASRDFHATQQVEFFFRPHEAAIFREWWRLSLRRGGLWFLALWPHPAGLVTAVRRFVAPPHRRRVPGGSWIISGTVEVRGRSLPPEIEARRFIYTTWPYALVVEDSADFGLAVPVVGNLAAIQKALANLGLSIPTAGELAEILRTFSQPAESANIGISVPVSAELAVVLREFAQPPEHTANFGLSIPLSGELVVRLVPYHHPAERVNVGLAIPLSGELS